MQAPFVSCACCVALGTANKNCMHAHAQNLETRFVMEEPPASKAEVPDEDGQQRLAHEEPVEALRLSKARVAKARVDSSIGDEDAGRARAELAAATEARRTDERRELAQRSTDLRRRTRRPAQRTDDDIADEVAGAARISFAAASRARRDKEQRALAIKNAEYHRRIRETNARTSSLRGTGSSGSAPGTSSSMNIGGGSTVVDPPTVMAVILRGQQQALAEARAVAAATSAELAKRRVAAESGLTADQRRMRRSFVGTCHGSSSSNGINGNARNEGEDVLGATRTGRDEDGAATAGDSLEATAAASAADAIAAKRVEQTASTEASIAASRLQPNRGRPSTAATSKLEASLSAASLNGQGVGTAPRRVSLPASAMRKPGYDARHDARETSIKDEEEYEPTHMAYLRITTLDRNRPTGDPRANPAWDRAPFRPVPYELRGIRPLRYMHEPWTEAARHAWDEQPLEQASSGLPVPSDDANASKAVVIAAVVRHTKPTRTLAVSVTSSRVRGAASPYTMPFATAGLTRLDDGGPSYPGLHDDMATLHRQRQLENEASVTTGLHAQPWDSTPWHSVPSTLRGLKPVTPEPWASTDGELCDMEAITIFHDYDKFRAGDAKEEMPELLALKHATSSANAVTAAARSRRRTSTPRLAMLCLWRTPRPRSSYGASNRRFQPFRTPRCARRREVSRFSACHARPKMKPFGRPLRMRPLMRPVPPSWQSPRRRLLPMVRPLWRRRLLQMPGLRQLSRRKRRQSWLPVPQRIGRGRRRSRLQRRKVWMRWLLSMKATCWSVSGARFRARSWPCNRKTWVQTDRQRHGQRGRPMRDPPAVGPPTSTSYPRSTSVTALFTPTSKSLETPGEAP